MLSRCIYSLRDDNASCFKRKKTSSHVQMSDRLMTSVLRDCSGECRRKKNCRAITCIIACYATMTNDTIYLKRAAFFVI